MVSRATKQIVLDEYLMTQINEVTENQEAEKAAFDACLIIAFAGDKIDEFRLSMYMSSVELPTATILRSLQFFAGAKFLKVDCFHEKGEGCFAQHVMNPTSELYLAGKEARETESDVYLFIKNRIEGFQEEFWGENW